MITPDRARTALDRIENAIEESILKMSEQEILAEAEEDGVDLAVVAARGHALVAEAIRIAEERRAKPRLAVFCDICATGVWLDGACVDPMEDVGLSLDTADRLRAWQLVYDLQDPHDEDDTWEERWGAWHDREGERIRALVWQEVGDRFRRS